MSLLLADFLQLGFMESVLHRAFCRERFAERVVQRTLYREFAERALQRALAKEVLFRESLDVVAGD